MVSSTVKSEIPILSTSNKFRSGIIPCISGIFSDTPCILCRSVSCTAANNGKQDEGRQKVGFHNFICLNVVIAKLGIFHI
jgi:hypothetical protein